jgi:hypothetical protein
MVGPPPPPPAASEPPPPPPPPEPGLCPTCGAPHEPFQEYCLECGHRLPSPYGTRRDLWTRDSPIWLWAALLSLLLVALVAGALVAIAATRNGDDGQAGRSVGPVVSTGPSTTDTVGITQPPTVTINPPTTTFAPTTTFSPTTTLSTTTSSTTTTSNGNVAWPAGKDGYSIFLKSVPTNEGRSQADAAAARARSNGLTQVGVLNSSDFSSLNPGYWVTFTGIYDTESQAKSGLANARSKGFPTAYVRRVAD